MIIDEHYDGFNPVQSGYEDCEPCHSYGPAVREFWLLHYVRKGTGIFRRDGKEYTVKAGEVFVIPPYLETYYEADAKQPWEYIWVGFTAGVSLPPAFEKPVLRNERLGEIFESMLHCRHMRNGRSAYLSGKIWELVALLLDADTQKIDPVERALHYMHAEYMNAIRVGELAERLHLDRCYFSTLFTKRLGVSPSQYLIDLRLEKAAELMVTYGKSPSIAAASVGYPDIYAFSKTFKKKFGCSPRQYVAQKSRASQ